MAEEKKQTETKPKDSAVQKDASQSTPWYVWLIIASVAASGLTGGFALSQLLGGTDPVPPAQNTGSRKDTENAPEFLSSQKDAPQNSWLYEEMEPVIANLDEPGVTRYVRATISLELSSQVDPEKGKVFLEEKKMIMRDWLTTYFAGLSLEDVRGTRNLERIKRQIQDQFNEILFPDGKPYVRRVLFREFAVQ